jgi:hypothetical protein
MPFPNASKACTSHGQLTPGLEEVLMQLRTAIKLLQEGCPSIAEGWAYRAADALHEENQRRRANSSEGKHQ